MIDDRASEDELQALDRSGVRGVRLNLMTPRLTDRKAAFAQLNAAAIVNIASGAPKNGCAGEYVWYVATKGAINAFTLGLGAR